MCIIVDKLSNMLQLNRSKSTKTKIRILALVLFCIPLLTLGQRKQKPTLLVYGADVEALAVAVQSAMSSVPTLWVTGDERIASSLTTYDIAINANNGLDGGIWMDILMRMAQSKTQNDSIAAQIKSAFSAEKAESVIQELVAEMPLLTIVQDAEITKIAHNRRGWNVVLSNRSKYQLRTVVDASTDQSLSAMVSDLTSKRASDRILRSDELSLEAMRTTIAIGDDGGIYGFTRDNLLVGEKDNFFTLQGLSQFTPSAANIPLRMQFAQSLGAAAAYTAFFRATSDKIDVRKLQTELMTYGSRLVPYTDISIEDPHFLAYQKTYLIGIFTNTDNTFDKERHVRFDEIAPVLNRLYSRSQLWFLDNKGEYLTWKDLLSLVKFVGLRGNEIDRQIEKDWGSKLAFEAEFDLDKLVTRAEFAVILDRFASPYAVSVSNSGEIMR